MGVGARMGTEKGRIMRIYTTPGHYVHTCRKRPVTYRGLGSGDFLGELYLDLDKMEFWCSRDRDDYDPVAAADSMPALGCWRVGSAIVAANSEMMAADVAPHRISTAPIRLPGIEDGTLTIDGIEVTQSWIEHANPSPSAIPRILQM